MKRALLLCLALPLLALLLAGAFFLGRPQPLYGWLAFGPEGRVRVLLRLEGGALYLDGDGRGQKFDRLEDCRGVVFVDPDGKTSYVLRAVEDMKLVPSLGKGVFVDVRVEGRLAYRQDCALLLAGSPARAPTAHFGGPLAMDLSRKMDVERGRLVWKLPEDLLLRHGKPAELYAGIVTDDGHGARAGVWVQEDGRPVFPKGVHPVVDVEYPPKEPGGPPVKRRYALDQFC